MNRDFLTRCGKALLWTLVILFFICAWVTYKISTYNPLSQSALSLEVMATQKAKDSE